MQRSVRTLAAQALAPLLKPQEARSLSSTLPTLMNECTVRDRGLLVELVQGTARQYVYLARLIEKLVERPVKEPRVQALLAIGLYQLLFTRIPAHAAVQETVNAAKQMGQVRAVGLINAILRRFQREQEALVASCRDAEHAHPGWVLQRFRRDWPDQASAILKANNEVPPLILRINALKTTREAYLKQLQEVSVSAFASAISCAGIILNERQDITQLPGFAEGLFSVQDSAAQLAAEFLEVRPGDRVLDACCAPGGKTSHILEIQPTAQVLALDNDDARMERVRENLDRLGLHAELRVADANTPDAWWDEKPFDRILVDAPCSATGVIRRHPDIKLLRRETDISELYHQQQSLLNRLWPLLASGGILLYATCSVFKKENEEQIGDFLRHHDDAEEISIETDSGISRPHGRQWLPGENDGFYYAKLRKR